MTVPPARTRAIHGAVTCLSLAAAALEILDAARSFSLVHWSWAALSGALALGALIALPFLRRSQPASAGQIPSSRPGGYRGELWSVASLLAVLALSVNTVAHGRRVDALPESGPEIAHVEIESRARLVQDQFQDLLSRMAAPLERARDRLSAFAGGDAAAFALLQEIDEPTGFTRWGGGLCLYTRRGAPRAWAGSSFPIPPALLEKLDPDAVVYRATADEPLSRLYAILQSGEHILVSETTLVSVLDDGPRDRVLPALAGDDDVMVRFQDARIPESGFADLLLRRGDLYRGGALGERETLFVGLRSSRKNLLGYVRLQGSGPADLRRTTDVRHRDAGALLLILLLAVLCLLAFYRRPPSATRVDRSLLALSLPYLGGLLLVWMGRGALSWFSLHAVVGGVDLFDSSLFASTGLFHLYRSPGDLLITSAAWLATSILTARTGARVVALGARTRWRGPLSVCGAIGLIAGILIAVVWLPRLAGGLVDNSSVNLLAIEPLSPSAPTLVLLASSLLSLLSGFLLLQTLAAFAFCSRPGHPAARMLPRPGDGLSSWVLRALLPGLILSGILYDVLLVPQARRAMADFLEKTLAPQVIHQQAARRAELQRTIEALEMFPELPDKILMGVDKTGTSLALDIWLRTPLRSSGYNASLLVLDAEGNEISRFARNLSPAFDRRAPESVVALPDEPALEPVEFLSLRKNIWHAEHLIYRGDELAGSVTIHLPDDFDNQPFLTHEKPYARALGTPPIRMPTLPAASGGVLHTVYDARGKTLYANQRKAPTLPPRWTEILVSDGAAEWSDVDEDGRQARYLFFSDGRRLYALGYAQATPLERVARIVRLEFLALILGAVLLFPAALLRRRAGSQRWWEVLLAALGRTHYRKLLASYTASTLIPLAALSVLMSGYIVAEIEKDIETRGRQASGSAVSLLRMVIETNRDLAGPDEDTLYWLSHLVGEDVNLYRNGELVATSRPELFLSGLLSPRVDGTVYRALTLEGRRFAMDRESLRGEEYRTIAAPLEADEPGWQGLLTLPLDAQAAEAIQGARDVADTMIITFLFMVLLMGGIGYLLARRLSRPIRSLSAAAARIATGDLDAVVADRPRDETGELISSFNLMARALKMQRDDLERRKDYIEKILRNATIGVISMDRSERIVTVNPAAGSILGIPDLADGQDIGSIFRSRPALTPLARALAGPIDRNARDVELTVGPPPAEKSVRARIVTFLEGEGIILLLEDVTETVRSNRLAAWAEMARRIAHEIKNPLTPIQLSAEHIARVHAEGTDRFPRILEECLRTIMKEVQNLRQISSEFSTYARIPTPRKELLDTTDLIQQTVRPYRTAPPPGVEVALEVSAGMPAIEADRSLIGRALINLIENALQAMPRGGTLTVRGSHEGSRIVIEVIDTGVGMDTASARRIFEPYFSTKDAGTGLGLAIARKAIEEHDGRIEVESAPGMGTTMRVVLPAALARDSAESPSGLVTAPRESGLDGPGGPREN